jgi:hypothetical protein
LDNSIWSYGVLKSLPKILDFYCPIHTLEQDLVEIVTLEDDSSGQELNTKVVGSCMNYSLKKTSPLGFYM